MTAYPPHACTAPQAGTKPCRNGHHPPPRSDLPPARRYPFVYSWFHSWTAFPPPQAGTKPRRNGHPPPPRSDFSPRNHPQIFHDDEDSPIGFVYSWFHSWTAFPPPWAGTKPRRNGHPPPSRSDLPPRKETNLILSPLGEGQADMPIAQPNQGEVPPKQGQSPVETDTILHPKATFHTENHPRIFHEYSNRAPPSIRLFAVFHSWTAFPPPKQGQSPVKTDTLPHPEATFHRETIHEYFTMTNRAPSSIRLFVVSFVDGFSAPQAGTKPRRNRHPPPPRSDSHPRAFISSSLKNFHFLLYSITL